MKALIGAFLFGFATILTPAPAAAQTMALHDVPRPLPRIEFADEAGRSLTLANWRGKIVLLNIWATWCGPCREEMPTLDRLQERLGGEQFEVIALSIDRGGASVVRDFFDEIGIDNLPIHLDASGEVLRSLKLFGLPGTILVGPSGDEFARFMGPASWDSPEMVAFFERVIADTFNRT